MQKIKLESCLAKGVKQMEKNIYDLLNETEHEIDEHHTIQLTEIEEKRIMKKFSKSITQTTKKNYTKVASIAAAAVVMIGAVGAVPTLATTNATLYKIATALGIEKNLSDYETIVGKEITKDGITMRINEVILDNNRLFVAVTTTSEEPLENHFIGPTGVIYVNGQEINSGMSVQSKVLNATTGVSVLTFPLGKQEVDQLDIKLVLKTPISNVMSSPHWTYTFRANGEVLHAQTQTVAINQQISVDTTTHITLHDYQSNLLRQGILFSIDGVLDGNIPTDVVLKGQDEYGNEVALYPGSILMDGGEFTPDEESVDYVKEATCLTLQMLVKDVPAGEPFTIEK